VYNRNITTDLGYLNGLLFTRCIIENNIFISIDLHQPSAKGIQFKLHLIFRTILK